MFITLNVLKLDTSNSVNNEQPENILAMFVTFDVLIWLRPLMETSPVNREERFSDENRKDESSGNLGYFPSAPYTTSYMVVPSTVTSVAQPLTEAPPSLFTSSPASQQVFLYASGRPFWNVMLRTLDLSILESRTTPLLLRSVPDTASAWAGMNPMGANTAIIATASRNASDFTGLPRRPDGALTTACLIASNSFR